MATSHVQYMMACALTIAILGCAAGEPTGSAQKTAAPELFDHKADRDTIDWQSVLGNDTPPDIPHTALEWPGEQMGLIGPIIATGGRGSRQYVLVYDPAGVLVGGLTHKEINKNPERLVKLILLAHKRGEIQNLYAMAYMATRKIHDEMAAAAVAEKETP